MTPEERIDAALECILEMACCASLEYLREMHPRRYYDMRKAMRKIMVDSYIQGSNDAHDAMMGKDKS